MSGNDAMWFSILEAACFLPACLLHQISIANVATIHLVTLSSVEDDALGEELQVIWEIEPGATTIEKTPLPEPIGFDTPQWLDTFPQRCPLGCGIECRCQSDPGPLPQRC